MDEAEKREFGMALLEFVKRAASKEATTEEVAALPAVAKVLVDAIQYVL